MYLVLQFITCILFKNIRKNGSMYYIKIVFIYFYEFRTLKKLATICLYSLHVNYALISFLTRSAHLTRSLPKGLFPTGSTLKTVFIKMNPLFSTVVFFSQFLTLRVVVETSSVFHCGVFFNIQCQGHIDPQILFKIFRSNLVSLCALCQANLQSFS